MDQTMTNDTTPRKMLRILDLIEESDAPVMADEMLKCLGFTRSTLYRYLKTLMESGLISSMPDCGYTFGPRIAELDYRMRQRDLLIAVSKPVMAELASSERGVTLLCRRHKDRVLCVHQEQGASGFRSKYERGLARPLFHGAASRIILAYLKPQQIHRLYARVPAEFAQAGFGGTVSAVRESLRLMRQRGWEIAHGQVTSGVTGIAVPLFNSEHEVLGSLNLTIWANELNETEKQRLIDRLKFCAAIVCKTLEQHTQTSIQPSSV